VTAAIDDCRSSGMTEFDFGGAGHPDDDHGVRDFKAKFGGELVDYGRDLLIPSSVRYRVVSSGYDLVRRFL